MVILLSFLFNSLPHLARLFGLQDEKYLTECPTSLQQKMPNGSLSYFQICFMTRTTSRLETEQLNGRLDWGGEVSMMKILKP